MDKITLDPGMRSRLSAVDREVELCDEQGQTLGYFVPAARGGAADLETKLLYAWARAAVSDEELEAAERQGGGRTTAEVLERLGRLDP